MNALSHSPGMEWIIVRNALIVLAQLEIMLVYACYEIIKRFNKN